MCRSDIDFDRRALIGFALALTVPQSARAQDATQIAGLGEAIDVGGVAAGDWLKVLVDGNPIYVRHRTAQEIAAARADDAAAMPEPVRDSDRAPDPEWLSVSGTCTHAGCTATCGLGPYKGFMCLCHGSVYDLSGRVRGGPAKRNLAIVQYRRGANEIVLLG